LVQAVYYATKAYVTSWSNALWRELKGTGVTVTALMPGAMQTGFANAGGLADTRLFANAVDPMQVARDGYEGMLKGELNVTSGLPGWQRPMMALAPLFPKKTMLDFVYDQQVAGSANK
jgi:short-subunit dehydrogenase